MDQRLLAFFDLMNSASTDISPEIRGRLGDDVEELLMDNSVGTNIYLPKIVGADHGGEKQALVSLLFWPPSLHGLSEAELRILRDDTLNFEDVDLNGIKYGMSHVYMGTLDMKSNVNQVTGKRGVEKFRGNEHSSRSDRIRYTPLLIVVEDIANPYRTSAVSSFSETLEHGYADRFNAEKVAVVTMVDRSITGFPNASGLRLLYNPRTHEIFYPSTDLVPYGPTRHIHNTPGLEYFSDVVDKFSSRIAGDPPQSYRNDIPDLAKGLGIEIPEPRIINMSIPIVQGGRRGVISGY